MTNENKQRGWRLNLSRPELGPRESYADIAQVEVHRAQLQKALGQTLLLARDHARQPAAIE